MASSAATAAKPRYEWYQTATHITIVLWVKGATSEAVSVSVVDSHLEASVKLPSGSEFAVDFDLFAKVLPDPALGVFGTKVEVRLTKDATASFMWPSLEAAPGAPVQASVAAATVAAKAPVAAAVAAGPAAASATSTDALPAAVPLATAAPLPSAWASRKDWNKVEAALKKEEEEEKPEGEEALHKLFRSIYSGADEDTRRAMVKSFQTSGGKVLSTNWGEVKAKDYEGADKVE